MKTEPTAEMVAAGIKAFRAATGGYASLGEKLTLAYRAMVAAQPDKRSIERAGKTP